MKFSMRRFKWEFPFLTVPALCGFADTFQIANYAINGTSMAGVGIAILFKAAVLAIFHRRSSASPHQALAFIGALAAALLVSEILSPYQSIDGLAQVAGVAVSLSLSCIAASGPRELGQYGRSLVNWTCAYSLLFLLEAAAGQIETHIGRYYYFHGQQPNLCADINGAAILVACIVFPQRALLLRLPILFAPLVITEGRAGMLAALLAVGIKFGIETAGSARKNMLPILAGAMAALLAIYIKFDSIVRFFAALFLLDDAYRGGGTGFVGRSDRWAEAFRLILERPLLGNGASIYDVSGIESAHNFLLHGFVFIGLGFALFLCWMGLIVAAGYRQAPRATAILGAALVLMFFNDRFFNFSLHPFVIYVFALSLAAPLRAGARYRRRGPVRMATGSPTARLA